MRRAAERRRYPWSVTPEELSTAIVGVLTSLSDEGALTLPDGVPTTVTVERPRQRDHGDYATNVALQLAKKAGTNPRDLATLGPEAAGGGRRDRRGRHRGARVPQHPRRGGRPGRGRRAGGRARASATGPADTGAGEKVNVEFVSANPTGPVTLASARWAAVGDTLARLLTATGSDGHRASTTSTTTAPRSTGSAGSLLASARERADPGGRLPRGATSPRSPTEVVAGATRTPPVWTTARRWRPSGAARRRADVRGDQADARRTSGSTSTSTSTRTTCTRAAPSQRAIARLTELGNTYEADGALWLATDQVR